jgi:hypothetical protein
MRVLVERIRLMNEAPVTVHVVPTVADEDRGDGDVAHLVEHLVKADREPESAVDRCIAAS